MWLLQWSRMSVVSSRNKTQSLDLADGFIPVFRLPNAQLTAQSEAAKYDAK